MMKMTCTSILVVVVVFSTLFGSVLASCKFSPVLVYSVSETAPNVTYIFNFTKDAGDAVTFSVKQNTLSNEALQTLNSSFRLREKDNTSVIFETTKTLDLEAYWIQYQADIITTVVTITCAGSGTEVTIAVQPVNEFAPVFQHGPFNITLKESTPVGTTVFTLKDKIDDPDRGEQPNFVFAIKPYTISSLDGSEFFNIPTSTRGDIAVAKVLDYDNPSIKKPLTLNLSVTDQGGLKGITFLIVKIEDVDDQKPYFEFPNCASPCPIPPFLAITELDTKGPLEIIPIPIKGYDNDTLGTKLLYNITSGNELGMFSMDPNTGSVTQIKSVNEVRSPAAKFRLVVQVRKNIPTELQSEAILTVKVRERMSNDTGFPPTPGKSTEDPGIPMGLLIPMIVLGVLLVIALVALVVVIIIYRRKKLEMSVKPIDDKSEPQTEEEDLHTEGEDYIGRADSNEKLVFGNKTTLGIMTDLPPTPEGRANRLAPLPFRDTGTETEGNKKKRSRKRNKNKEPEIFDGTKEYNMGLDPEFFDSTDKSKVKRSQRSKKADSSQQITVPNDNPPDEGSIYN